MATPQETSPRLRIWRLLFAIVGVLDCSCFCYCYFHHNGILGENHKLVSNQKSLSPREEQEKNVTRHLRARNRDYDVYGIPKEDSCTATPDVKLPFRLSDVVWHSMVFSFTTDTAHAKGSNKPYRSRLGDSDSYNTYQAFLLVHVLFGIFCAIEMILRAKESRRLVFENQAIAAFEEHLASTVAKAYHRRNLLRGKGRFSHFTLRRPSEIGKKLTSPITTGTLKRNPYVPSVCRDTIQEETRTSFDSDENNSHDNDNSNDRVHHNKKDDDPDDMDEEAVNKRNILLFLRSTFRLWVPIGVTCLFWLSLLPFQAYYRIIRIFLHEYSNHSASDVCVTGNDTDDFYRKLECSNLCDADIATQCYVETLGDDTSWATLWITAVFSRLSDLCEYIEDYLMSEVWLRYLTGGVFSNQAKRNLATILNRPKLIWIRVGRILKVAKWMRFAFPLARMVIKLQDQLFAGYYTLKKVRTVRTNRQRRLQRPSLLMKDLRRIESFHKVETTIAAWPSHCNMLLETLAKEVSQYSAVAHTKLSSTLALAHAEQFLERSRERGKQITMKIQRLQVQLRKSMTEFSSQEIYDSILKLSQGVSKRNLFAENDYLDDVQDRRDNDVNEVDIDQTPRKNSLGSHGSHRSVKHRWYDFLHLQSLLSSHDYLISPRSRFSVVWRITVTNCLLLELARLAVSWHLTQTFYLSISQVLGRLFVDCGNTKEDTRRKFKFVTDIFEEWHVGLSKAIPLVPYPKDSLWILCTPTSNFSKLLLLLGSTMEIFIDVVSFLDIFFWFFTGDLDAASGIVVPKPFFGRCILPGTLVQVIDHPTLPDFLPSLLGKFASLASGLGWSRLMLWACALCPALVAELVLPLVSYFFRHYEEFDDRKGRRGSNRNNDSDILMTYAESFGYLPTRSSLILDRTNTAPRWFHDDVDDKRWSENQPIDNNGEGDFNGVIGESVSRWPRLMRKSILTPPGSLRRHIGRGSSVRFNEDLSMIGSKDESDEPGSPQLLYSSSSADFDIGLSLSWHDFDNLNNVEK